MTWPIYCLDSLKFTDGNSKIKFRSWKGDYDPVTYGIPYGNLPYRGISYNLKGSVWTRGQ